MKTAATVVVAWALTRASLAFAADARFPDWPCVQIKVPELSAAAVWSGPSIDDVGNAWQDDADVRDTVALVAARRTPLDEADAAINKLLATDGADKQTKAKLLFAGVFATLNRERSTVMDGIERYSRRQMQFAEKIRTEARQMRELQDAPDRDETRVDELTNTINWDTRIFEEQRKTVGYVCEVPTTIERRLGALARIIQQASE